MNQTRRIHENIKKHLKYRGFTYSDLAKHLELSESSVKRLFVDESLSVQRLEQISLFLDVPISQIALLEGKETSVLQQYTVEHEEALAEDDKFYSVLVLLYKRLTPLQILDQFDYSEAELNRYLIYLEKLGLIKYHTMKKVELLIKRNPDWNDKGPLDQKYGQLLKQEFIEHDFAGKNEDLCCANVFLSDASLNLVKKRIAQLLNEIEELAEAEEYSNNHCDHFAFVIGYMPWLFPTLKDLRKNK